MHPIPVVFNQVYGAGSLAPLTGDHGDCVGVVSTPHTHAVQETTFMSASHCPEVDFRWTTKCEFVKFLVLVYL